MTGKRRMTNEELEQTLKDAKYARTGKNYFSKIDSKLTKEAKAEFKRRDIKDYTSETVDADISAGYSNSPNMKRILNDYTLEELHSMGAIRIDLEKFQKKARKTVEEMVFYITKKPGKKQLNIRPKPEVSEDLIEESFEKLMSYPKA